MADIDIGGLTRAEAVAALTEAYQDVEDLRYTFRDGERSWTARAGELGLSFPAEELVERAFSIGHSDDSRRSLREQAAAWFIGANLPATLKFDPMAARDFLRQLAAEIDRERQDASLRLDGTTVSINPGLTGRKLNVEATLSALSDAVLSEEA